MYSFSFTSLLVFYEAVKAKSLSKAAKKLFMTQPGVSHHVAQLEAQTGNQLLFRQKGKFELTKEGKILFRQAEKFHRAVCDTEDTIQNMRSDGRPVLRIGTTVSYSQILMPSLLGSLQKASPQIMIKLDAGSSQEMLETVLSGKNDICIVANPGVSRKLYAFPIVGEELVLITAKNHPLSGQQTISLGEIADYPFIIREEGSATRRVILTAFAAKNITPWVLIEAKSTDFIKEWVSQGKGVSILIARSVTEEEKKTLNVVRLKNPLYLEITALCLSSRKYSPLTQTFLEHLRKWQHPSPDGYLRLRSKGEIAQHVVGTKPSELN